jgi:heavy metal sensor kinase
VKRASIRFRLTAWYAGVLAITFALVGIGVWLALRDSINETVDKDLRSRLAAVRALLARPASEPDDSLDEVFENAPLIAGGASLRFADAQGHWIFRSPGTEDWNAEPLVPSRLAQRGRVQTLVERGKPFRVLSATVPNGIVQIGVPLREFDEMLSAFTWTAVLVSPVLLLLASAGGYWMSRRALAPVDEIARTAGGIEARRLSERLPLRGIGDELDHLSTVLNGMLARLEDSFRHVTQFTADASHELRTPVSAIRTTAEVIRRRRRSESEYEAALDRILTESERATSLIEDLLTLARADANADELECESLDLAEVANSAWIDARLLAESKGVRLAPAQLETATVTGDAQALRRMVVILIDNAIKYSRAGGDVRLRLDRSSHRDRDFAQLAVRDDGVGIATDDLPHIFERFYRASKDRSRQDGGAGLGLAIAHSIVERHGGEIAIESKPGNGTVVRVFLPLQ